MNPVEMKQWARGDVLVGDQRIIALLCVCSRIYTMIGDDDGGSEYFPNSDSDYDSDQNGDDIDIYEVAYIWIVASTKQTVHPWGSMQINGKTGKEKM